ncbi:MAG: protein BatD [Calditrichaeota bacterium]|nr:MAG: protein BatD [Calditrichota bacterium]MBL1203814.1 protein BatD [Calditrichota bacterium]NOG43644.1 protein BatD [Calditrichota bacterium]
MIKNFKFQKSNFKIGAIPVILISLILVFPELCLAQDVNIKAFVSKNKINSEERFEYSVEVSGKSTSLPDIKFAELKDFFVLSGPNQSTNIQFVNGAMTSSKTLSFVLKPRKVGQLVIGKATLEFKGTTYETKPITINVTKANPAAQKQQTQRNNQNNNQISSDNIFLRSHISKKKAFIGEQIVVEYKLYFKVNVRTYELESIPSNVGFWTEDFDLPQRPQIESEVINGVNYQVATLKKVAAFATRVGDLELDPLIVNVEAVVASRRNRRSLFDSFFEPSGRSVRKQLSSKKIKLKISALPEKNKPSDFAGAVGGFNFNVKADKISAEVNEAVTLKIDLSGAGNIKLTELPVPEIPPDIEKYDPKLSSNISKKGGIISGTKNAEYLLIPRVPGTFKIKPISFSYFDPVKKKYFTKTSGPLVLNVSGEANPTASSPMAGFSRKEVTMIGRDIRFIKESTVFQKISDRGYFSGTLIGGFILSVFLFAGFLFYDDHRAKIDGNIALKRNRYAGKLAAKFLSEAHKNIQMDDANLFYKSVSAALSKFVQDKLNIELTDFNVKNVETALKKRQITDDIIKDYTDLVSECDFMQFASNSGSQEEKQNILEKAKVVITKMEKYI